MEKRKLQWHPAFGAALRITLKEEMEFLGEELTITFACSRYPREMLKHLAEIRRIHVENLDKGIYYLTGDAIPMQLLITRELTQEENFWLKNLRTDLKAGREIQNIVAKYEQNRHSKD